MAKEKIKKANPKRMSGHPMQEPIEKLYSKSAPVLMFEALLFLVASIAIFIKPVQILTTLTAVLGVFLGLFGIYQLFIGFFGGKNEMAGKNTNIVVGLLNVILGIVFFTLPAGSMITMVYIFAILFFVRAITSVVFSIKTSRARFGNYAFDIFIAIMMIALAVLILFFPMFGAVTVMYYIAITLFLYALADINMYFKLLKLKKIVS